jgi:hypothetical protein
MGLSAGIISKCIKGFVKHWFCGPFLILEQIISNYVRFGAKYVHYASFWAKKLILGQNISTFPCFGANYSHCIQIRPN